MISVDHRLFVVLATPPSPHRQLVASTLTDRGVRISAVDSLPALRTASIRLRPDVVIVDVGLAAHEFDILEFVRSARVPLIAISVHDLASRVELLLAGADDCLPRRFEPEELTARIVAVVRRAHCTASSEAEMSTRVGPVQIDLEAREVTVCGAGISLTIREFDLLSYMVTHPGVTLSRDRLLANVWGYTFGDTSTVTVHVRRLRSKIEADPSRPQLIHTVRGIGYRFCTDDHPTDTAGPAGPPGVPALRGVTLGALRPAHREPFHREKESAWPSPW